MLSDRQRRYPEIGLLLSIPELGNAYAVTKGITPAEAQARAVITGDAQLGARTLTLLAIMA